MQESSSQGLVLTLEPKEPLRSPVESASSYLAGGSEHWVYKKASSRLPLAEYAERDTWPLPANEDRVGYNPNDHIAYWASGVLDYHLVKDCAEAAGVTLKPGSRVLDFGCASGRVLRNFAVHEQGLQAFGADINSNHIAWIKRYLPSSIVAFQNTILPQMPFRDASIDVAYAFSVFTHIDDFEEAWLLEMARILKPGGAALFTIASQTTWNTIKPELPLYDVLLASRERTTGEVPTAETFKGPMPERSVFRYEPGDVYQDNVMHTHSYIQEHWGRIFDVVEIRAGAHSHQDMVVMRAR